MCKIGWQNNCLSSKDAEILSILAAIDIANELHMKDVEFISDNTDVIWFLSTGLGEHCQSNPCWYQAFTAFSRNPGWTIKFFFRENNQIADGLAKHALRRSWEWTRPDAIPMELTQLKASITA